jgi:hypothetical protein
MTRPLILMLLLAAGASPQTHPNFSGAWKQDNSRSTIRPGSTIQYSNQIDHREVKLSVTTILGANEQYKESRNTREYIIGGEPQVTTDREGYQFTNTVKWEGDSLVFETVEKEKSATLTSREVWTLSSDGKTLTKKIHRTGGRGADSDQTYVLEKQDQK